MNVLNERVIYLKKKKNYILYIYISLSRGDLFVYLYYIFTRFCCTRGFTRKTFSSFLPQRRRYVDHAVHDQTDRKVDREDQSADGYVVHEVFADARRVMDHRHVNAIQMFFRSDAWERKNKNYSQK